MADALKAAVIGTGAISKEHLSFLSQSNQAKLVGVCDLSPIAAQYAAERFSADAHYTDYGQMLERAQPDVVHILTPPQTHQTIATHCLQHGAHVICEKPMTLTYCDFKDLWEVAQGCQRVLLEDQNYRFNEPILAIQELIQSGALGAVQDVEVRLVLDLRSGGRFADENLPNPVHQLPAGVIHDFITHISYLALCFVPDLAFNHVNACWNNHGGGDLFKYDDLDALIVDGTRHVRLRFSCHTQPDELKVAVRGRQGWAETDLFQPYLRCSLPRNVGQQLTPLANQFIGGWGLVGSSVRNFRRKVMQKTPYEGLHRLMARTYSALQEGTAPPLSFEDMAQTSRMVDALLAEENPR